MRRAFFFIVAIVFATTSLASIPRVSALDAAPSIDDSLAETRIRVSEVLAPFERSAESELTRALRQGYEQVSTTNASGLGRFLSVDPVIDFKTNLRSPQGWNRYSYVRNNPMRWTDPTGRVIEYDDEFRKRVRTDAQFRKAFEAWKQTKSGAAQWRAMARDTNTTYKFSVRQVKEMTGPLKESEVYGSTRPIVGPRNENKSGKLDMPEVSMAINVDYIKSTLQYVPEIISREIAKNIFHEATHGLDFGSNTKSARQALSVDQQWLTGTEPRMNLFERELNQILPPPDFN